MKLKIILIVFLFLLFCFLIPIISSIKVKVKHTIQEQDDEEDDKKKKKKECTCEGIAMEDDWKENVCYKSCDDFCGEDGDDVKNTCVDRCNKLLCSHEAGGSCDITEDTGIKKKCEVTHESSRLLSKNKKY